MSNNQTSSTDEKLRYRLDLQAHQIDAVLGRHQVEGAVTSGTVRQRIVEFDVQAPLSAGLERVRGLKDSMMTALGVQNLALSKRDGRWRLQVDNPSEPPVALAGLIASLTDLPANTAVIGQTDSGQPVLLRFGSNEVRHVLIAGDSGAGKTTILRTIAISLALTNRQSDIQLLMVSGGKEQPADDQDFARLWRPLAYLPHLMTDLVTDSEVSAEVFHFLVGEMSYRRKQRVRLPRIIVLIDNVVALLETGGQQLTDDILRLLQHGNSAGIHLVASTSRPEAAVLDVLFMSNMTVRLAGKLSDPVAARKVMGQTDTYVEYLQGAGDFVALADESLSYFQAADMTDYDLHWELNKLLTSSRPRLLARPVDMRPAQVSSEENERSDQSFKRENGVQWVESQPTVMPVNSSTRSSVSSWSDEDLAGEQE